MVTTISKFNKYKERIIKAAGEAGNLGDICAVAHVLLTRIRSQGGGDACAHIMSALAVAAAAYHPEATTNQVTDTVTAKAQAEAESLFNTMIETLVEAYDKEPIAKGSEADVLCDGKLASEWTSEERCFGHIDEHVEHLDKALKEMIPACRLFAMLSMGGDALNMLKSMAEDRDRVAAKLKEEQGGADVSAEVPPTA